MVFDNQLLNTFEIYTEEFLARIDFVDLLILEMMV